LSYLDKREADHFVSLAAEKAERETNKTRILDELVPERKEPSKIELRDHHVQTREEAALAAGALAAANAERDKKYEEEARESQQRAEQERDHYNNFSG
jgi:hypothetical protein